MEDLRILILALASAGGYVRTSDNFVKTSISRGAFFLDHADIYREYGFMGAKKRIAGFIEDNNINCVIYMPSAFEFYFDVNFFEDIRKTCFTVMVSGEIETDYESRASYYAQAMDLVLLPNFTSVATLSQIGVDSMPYWGWYHPEKYSLHGIAVKTMDVSFLGQLNEKYGRKELIDYLSDGGIHVETFGPDSKSGVVSEEEKIWIYRSSKINLNLAGVNRKTRLTGSREIHRRAKQFKNNLFEAAFCGGFVLSEYVPGMENLFEIGVTMDVFRDKEELAEKVRYYLTHDAERESAAKRSMGRALKERRFDVEKAVPDLFAAIDERRRKKKYSPSEIYLDPEFIANYTSYRLWLVSWFIKAGKWRLAFDEIMTIMKRPVIDLYQLRIFLIEEVLDVFPKIKAFLKSLIERKQK